MLPVLKRFISSQRNPFSFSKGSVEMGAEHTVVCIALYAQIKPGLFSLGVRSSQQPMAEKTSLISSATSTPISATSSSGGRPARSASGSSPWAAAKGSTSSSAMYRTLGTTQSLSTSSGREASRAQVSTGMTDFTEVADSPLTHSGSPLEGPSPGELTLELKFQFSCKPKEDFLQLALA